MAEQNDAAPGSEARCAICNDTGVTDKSFGIGTSPGDCPVCSRAQPTPVSEAGGEATGDVWVLFSDGHPLFLSGSKHTAESARKGYAEDGKHTDGPFRYALAKPASPPAGGDVAEREVAAQAALARIKKIRDQYADQAKFADVDEARLFRQFVERLDRAAMSQSTSAGRGDNHGS